MYGLFRFVQCDDVLQLYMSSGCGYAYFYERLILLSMGWGKGSLEAASDVCLVLLEFVCEG